jgi:hypothetical protein
MFSPLKIFKKRTPQPVTVRAVSSFGISNFDQEAVLAAQRRRCLQPPPPVVITRAAKPNSYEPETPIVVVKEEIPNLDLPAFRYLKFKR